MSQPHDRMTNPHPSPDRVEELRPCPFCKGGAGLFSDDLDYYVECCVCGNRTSLADTKAEAIAAWNTRPESESVTVMPSLVHAAESVIAGMSSTYRARNGRQMGIEGDDGEKCWIVHSDDIEALREALARIGCSNE